MSLTFLILTFFQYWYKSKIIKKELKNNIQIQIILKPLTKTKMSTKVLYNIELVLK